MSPSPKIADEIARLMRDPDSMRAEAEEIRRLIGRGRYDPTQPRVPAGSPKGGQFASKGYRGGHSDRDASAMRVALDGAQFAELGQGNRGDARESFEGQLGYIDAGQYLASEVAFEQLDAARRQQKDDRYNFQTGRYRFLSTGPYAREPIPGGTRWVITSTTYARDSTIGAYATISATPARPMVIQFHYGKLFVTPVNLGIRRR
jgi:hypothetical protein